MTAAVRRPNQELAARFARDTEPLLDVLSRGARRLTRSDADADDLLQDTLLHAYSGFHTFQEGSNLRAWLFRILYNCWVSNHRRKQRRPVEVPVATLAEHNLVHRSAEAEVLDVLPGNDIKTAMDKLPASFKEAIYYADVQGYTYAETAKLLNIPMGTVMSRVARGRHRLRIALTTDQTCIA
ncbi:sigma-70 family RNA polymerase sigma factor [Mycolicibacterium pulveris]|uniref:sigma-70 family RNA polymerase sigma factor n=1 Tax=Mycolicibacterium pulveris TaxID=36813 RepID=UPI003CF4F428